MLKKRKKTNQMLRQAKLTERFTLKMASKGIQESFILLFIIIYTKLSYHKVGCVLPIVVVYILPLVEFGRNDHREDAPHFMKQSSIYFRRNFEKVAERDLKKFLKTQIKKKKRTPDFLSPNEIQKLQTINRRKQGKCSIENLTVTSRYLIIVEHLKSSKSNSRISKIAYLQQI